MIRFYVVRNRLVLISALLIGGSGMGGCAAPTSASSDFGQSDYELGHTELVAVDGNGCSNVALNAERSAGGPTPVGNEANAPQPEPWNGIDDPNGAPQPEPWGPKKIAPEPDPASSSPTPTPPR